MPSSPALPRLWYGAAIKAGTSSSVAASAARSPEVKAGRLTHGARTRRASSQSAAASSAHAAASGPKSITPPATSAQTTRQVVV